jgi:hypothetical protein
MGYFCHVHALHLRMGERPLDTLARPLLSAALASKPSRSALVILNNNATPSEQRAVRTISVGLRAVALQPTQTIQTSRPLGGRQGPPDQGVSTGLLRFHQL